MSSSSQTTVPSSQFEPILSAAVGEFNKRTGKNLLDDWLAKELQNCKSVKAVMDIIQGQAEAFDKFKNGSGKLMEWIRSSVHVLYTISATLGEGVGVAVPPAKAVFTGIGILLAAAEGVRASHDALVDLFERVQFFLKRLRVHTRISPAQDMKKILVKIMAEVISILSIATKEMQQSRTKTYIKKLLGGTDIEDALKKLDNLTQEEVRMAIAEVLQGIRVLEDDAKKTNDAVRELKDGVEEIKWDQIERDVRRWFSPPDPSVNYNTAREAHQEGTAAWFFQGGIFKEWELLGSLLWVHGKPGSGKSILSSAIIKHVISLRDAGDASLAYFFFDFRDKEKKQDPRNFLTSLLTQLSAHSNLCRKIIFGIYSKHGKGTQQPSIEDLTKCLHDMLFVATRRPVYLIIDALDECPNISGLPTPRAVLLGLLEDLVDLRIPNLHICITSRPEVDIKKDLEPLAYRTVSLHDESGQKKDIFNYVNTVVNSDKKMRKWRDEERKLVVKVLSERADGMFRWVYCQLEVLQHCITASIRQVLEQLPESLDETYARVLSQIPRTSQAHAHRLLQCLIAAVRPLRVEELAEVLAFEFDTARGAVPRYRAGWQSNDQEQAVLSICSSLIAIVDDNGSQVVQFSHFSVKEFLMSDRLASSPLGNFSQYQINPVPGHTILAQACLGFLLHLDDRPNEESVKSFPLAKYSAQHWVTHAQFEDVASRVKDGMESLFDCDKPYFAAWIRIYNIDDKPYRTRRNLPPTISTPLYYASLCGFSDLVKHLALKYPQHLNADGGWHNLPLLAALSRKHVEVAEILFECGANVDIGMRELTPLREADTDVSVVRFLLDHGAVNYRQKNNLRTPLHQVARDGELKMAQILLKYKANVDPRDNKGKTPFHLMLEERDLDTGLLGLGELLLKHGADVNTRDGYHNTPLHVVMAQGNYGLMESLLKLGADAGAENDAGETPLHKLFEDVRRAERGYHDNLESRVLDIIRLLLEGGADVNARDDDQNTPLHSAVSGGTLRVRVAKVLLGCGSIADAENDKGETPLNLVSRGKYGSEEVGVSVVRLLLERGVNVNAHDKYRDTPLHSAVYKGRPKIAKLLLGHGANPKAENGQGETPLHEVSRIKYNSQGVAIARLLLERGVNIHAQDKGHNTALHLAVFEGGHGLAQVLLDHGANPTAENGQGETPLHLLSRGKYITQKHDVSIAQLLLERGVDVHAQDKGHNTALHLAAFEGRLRLAEVLLDHGANPTAENDQGETPLHLLSRGKYDTQKHDVSIAQLLLERGADVNGRKRNKWTPLHLAVVKGRLEIVKVLLDHGANPNAVDEQGETPLHVVSQGKYDSQEDGLRIARLLLGSGADGQGETQLHVVSQGKFDSQEGGVGIARLLLERGADVNAPDKDRHTPFFSASYFGRFDIARLLLEHGAKDAEPANRGTQKADDVGHESEKKPELHEELHRAPWRRAHSTGLNA